MFVNRWESERLTALIVLHVRLMRSTSPWAAFCRSVTTRTGSGRWSGGRTWTGCGERGRGPWKWETENKVGLGITDLLWLFYFSPFCLLWFLRFVLVDDLTYFLTLPFFVIIQAVNPLSFLRNLFRAAFLQIVSRDGRIVELRSDTSDQTQHGKLPWETTSLWIIWHCEHLLLTYSVQMGSTFRKFCCCCCAGDEDDEDEKQPLVP